MTSETLLAIQEYIDAQHVLTLCVTDKEGFPWCACCFYVLHRETMTLYLMSQKNTQHGRLMMSNPCVAGTIFHPPESVATLQGIQFTGTIEELLSEQRKLAKKRYLQRFPIARLIPSPIWGLRLQTIKMTDNQRSFGYKRYWQNACSPSIDEKLQV
ncbi:MAG: YhbP family protein [Enterobacteriaceae bacterium]